MSDSSISSSLTAKTSSYTSTTAPSDELIQKLQAMPANQRDEILQSMEEKRPGFVAKVRQMLAQADAAAANGDTAQTSADPLAQIKAAASQTSQAYQWDALQWMQGAQGLSLLDFLDGSNSSSSATFPDADDSLSALGGAGDASSASGADGLAALAAASGASTGDSSGDGSTGDSDSQTQAALTAYLANKLTL